MLASECTKAKRVRNLQVSSLPRRRKRLHVARYKRYAFINFIGPQSLATRLKLVCCKSLRRFIDFCVHLKRCYAEVVHICTTCKCIIEEYKVAATVSNQLFLNSCLLLHLYTHIYIAHTVDFCYELASSKVVFFSFLINMRKFIR